jgi:hypothetical protein
MLQRFGEEVDRLVYAAITPVNGSVDRHGDGMRRCFATERKRNDGWGYSHGSFLFRISASEK